MPEPPRPIELRATVTMECAGSFYRARYYDPVRSRFASADPIGLRGGTNVYQYTAGNPITYVDPLGLIEWPLTAPSPDELAEWLKKQDASETECPTLQDWAECYSRCIKALDPVGNLADRLATSAAKKAVDRYLGGRLPTEGSREAWGWNQKVANGGMATLGAWQAGTSYGCMMSCARSSRNW